MRDYNILSNRILAALNANMQHRKHVPEGVNDSISRTQLVKLITENCGLNQKVQKSQDYF